MITKSDEESSEHPLKEDSWAGQIPDLVQNYLSVPSTLSLDCDVSFLESER